MKSIKETKEVKVNGQKIILKQLDLKQLIKVIGQVKDFQAMLQNQDFKNKEDFVGSIPGLIVSSYDDVKKMVVTAINDSNVMPEFVDGLTIRDLTSLIYELLKVNDYQGVLEDLGKIKGLKELKSEKKESK